MKRSLWFVLSLTMILSLSACGSPAVLDGSNQPESSSSQLSDGYIRRYPDEYRSVGDISGISVQDSQGEDITEAAIDLWFAANEVYNVDDTVMFEMGEGTQVLTPPGPEFYELKNYEAVVDGIFTENGRDQLERTWIGADGITFLQMRDGAMYRLGPWKTGYSYAKTLSGMRVAQAEGNTVVLDVDYISNLSPDAQMNMETFVPEYRTVPFIIRKVDGIWLVEDYIYPEARNRDEL